MVKEIKKRIDPKYLMLNEIERMNLNLLRTNSLLAKTVMIYFFIIIVAIALFITDYFTYTHFRFLILVGVATFVVGVLPIFLNIYQQKKQFETFMKKMEE